MKSVFKSVLLASLMATTGFSVLAQAPAMGERGGMMEAHGPIKHEGMNHDRMGRMDPAKMQAMADKRHTDLKAKLKLTAAQEGAWTTYIAAMKPPASMMANRPDRAEMAKLPTPERIDKMKALHTQHMAEMTTMMDKHGEATKAFYATLTAEQKTVFDTQSMVHHGMDRQRGGPRDGKGGPAQPQK